MKVRFSLLIAIATISCFCTDIYAQNQPLDNIVITDADKIRAIEEAERTRERSNRSTTYFTTTIETDASQTAGDGSILVVCIGQSVTFTATSSCQGDTTYILEADSLTYEWTIISGRFDTIVVHNAGSQISHTFSTSGNFLVKCKAYNVSNDTNTNNNTLSILVSSKPQLEASANFDTVCSGYEITLTGIAHQPQEESQENTLVSCNYSDSTQFLPDGCNLSFNMDVHSPDSFAIINSISEIDHFYMNIEHSYFGDLSIMLECPNGQKCMLHSINPNNSSLHAMDWTLTGGIHLEGSRGGANHYLGMAIDPYSSSPCYTAPGVGWTYRIYPNGTIPFGQSSPTTTYYSYITDPCEDRHATIEIVDTIPRNGKYGPYESMSSLIGCPINGTWSLHINDEISSDNGYLFDWGIVMENSINEWSYMNTSTSSPSSSPSSYTLSDFSWSGNGIDSVTTENGITTATAIPTVATGGNQEYTFSCSDNFGCSYDTTINIYVGRAIETPEIDMVVTDSLSHNTITWTAIDNDEIYEYRIYRSSDSTNYDLVASIPASEPTSWTDETTDFSVRPYWYCLTAVGECETQMSQPKESMYFTTIIETDVPQTTSGGITYANICNGQSITFTATNAFQGNATYEQNDENLTYEWTIVTGSYDTIVIHDAGRQISRTFDTSDGFRIKCQSHDIYNVINSNDNTIDVQVSVRPQIEATASQDSICSGSEITLNGTIHPEQWQSRKPVSGSYSSTDLIDGASTYSLTHIAPLEIHARDSSAILNSIDDIDHVYINLEHSYFADLSIMLECPNGQKCLLHAYSHYTSPTPMDWTLTGGIHLAGSSSAASNTMVGISPDPMYVSDPCYLTPGEGWTYRIYPDGTEPWGTNSPYHSITYTDSCGTEYTRWTIDTFPISSTRQYGPYESMTSLIGCPIDGTWKLYINDRFRGDNGYLFEWGIHMYEASDEWSYQNSYENSNLSWNGNGIATDTTDNGETIAIPVSSTTGLQEYTFSCTDNFGCTYDTSINVYVYRTTPVPEIKYVSTNVLNQNVIEFMHDNDEHITQYNIYRGTDNDDYEFAATLPPYTTIWTDMIADPTLQPYSYIVTSNDNCGESEMTSPHRTMHLNLEAGQNGNQTLNWTHYEGFQYDTYKIYRGANPFSMELIGEVPSDQNSFTDNNSDRSYCYYQIQISNANNTDIVAKSNIVGTILSSIEGYVSNLSVFPNPASTTLNITSSETLSSIEIFSATGQSVLQTNVNGDSTTCDIKHLASGIYLIVAHDSNGKIGMTKFTKE